MSRRVDKYEKLIRNIEIKISFSCLQYWQAAADSMFVGAINTGRFVTCASFNPPASPTVQYRMSLEIR
jgi:hypothetical protein